MQQGGVLLERLVPSATSVMKGILDFCAVAVKCTTMVPVVFRVSVRGVRSAMRRCWGMTGVGLDLVLLGSG